MSDNISNNLFNQNGGVFSSALYTKNEIFQISRESVPDSWISVINTNLNNETIPKIIKGKPGYSISSTESISNYKNTKTAWFLFGNNGEPSQDLLNNYSLNDIIITYILANTTVELLLNGANLEDSIISYTPYVYDILSNKEWNIWNSLQYIYRLTLYNNLIYNDSVIDKNISKSTLSSSSESSFVLPEKTIDTQDRQKAGSYFDQCDVNQPFLCGKDTNLVTSNEYSVERDPRGWCRVSEQDCNVRNPINGNGRIYTNWQTSVKAVPKAQREEFIKNLPTAGVPSQNLSNSSQKFFSESMIPGSRTGKQFIVGGFQEKTIMPESYIELIKTIFNGIELKDISKLNASQGEKDPTFKKTLEYLKISGFFTKANESKIGQIITQFITLHGEKKNLIQFEQLINIIIIYLRISILCVINTDNPGLNKDILKEKPPLELPMINEEDLDKSLNKSCISIITQNECEEAKNCGYSLKSGCVSKEKLAEELKLENEKKQKEIKEGIERIIKEGNKEENKGKLEVLEVELERYTNLSTELLNQTGGESSLEDISTLTPEEAHEKMVKQSRIMDKQVILKQNAMNIIKAKGEMKEINLDNLLDPIEKDILKGKVNLEKIKQCQASKLLENIKKIIENINLILKKYPDLKTDKIAELINLAETRSIDLKKITEDETCSSIIENELKKANIAASKIAAIVKSKKKKTEIKQDLQKKKAATTIASFQRGFTTRKSLEGIRRSKQLEYNLLEKERNKIINCLENLDLSGNIKTSIENMLNRANKLTLAGLENQEIVKELLNNNNYNFKSGELESYIQCINKSMEEGKIDLSKEKDEIENMNDLQKEELIRDIQKQILGSIPD